MSFLNQIVAGVNLVRAAIRSPNFVQGVSGWIVRRDGSAEFNDIVVRGGIQQGGVGLYYDGTPALGNLIMSISAEAGTDEFGNDYRGGTTVYDSSGSYIEINAGSGSTSVSMSPAEVVGTTWEPGYVTTALGPRLGTNTPIVAIQSPYNTDAASSASIQLFGNPEVSSGDVTNEIFMSTERVTVTGDIEGGGYVNGDNLQSGQASVTFASASSATVSVTFPTAYPAGVTPSVMTNIASGSGTIARWGSRAINVSNTGFQLFLFKGDSADPAVAWSGIPVQWWAHD